MQYCGGGAGGQVRAVQRIAAVALRQRQLPLLRVVHSRWRNPHAAADEVDGIAMPAGLRYTRQPYVARRGDEDGICHAGIDAFLSRALGKVDRIQYRVAEGAAPAGGDPDRGRDAIWKWCSRIRCC